MALVLLEMVAVPCERLYGFRPRRSVALQDAMQVAGCILEGRALSRPVTVKRAGNFRGGRRPACR